LAASNLRGFWADAWGEGFKTPEQTSALVDFAARYNFNAVFVQVRKRGDALYNSSLEPRDAKLPPDYDPLTDIIHKAHAKGIQVHAWVMIYDAWVESKWVKMDPGHVCAKHPDWISESYAGQKTYVQGRMYLDPGLPEVAEYLTSLVQDLVRRYPVDGVHLDGLRYPDISFGYNRRSINRFNAEFNRTGTPAPGDTDWCSWRQKQVTELARNLTKAIRSVRPSIRVSLAAYWNQKEARDRFFQDWPAWAKAGYFDFIVPMVFVPKSVPEFVKMVDDELAAGSGTPICIGQGTWRFPLETSKRHLRVIRGKDAPGYVLFDYGALSTQGPDGKCLADGLPLLPPQR